MSTNDWRALALGPRVPRREDMEAQLEASLGRLGSLLGTDQPSLASRMQDLSRMQQARLPDGTAPGPPQPGSPEAQLGLDIAGNFDFLGPIKAYHGSPHMFDRFDWNKIGTGEGAQAYGHGFYFAENPEVARGYASMTSDVVADAFNELADDYGNLGLKRADGNGMALYRSPDGVRNALMRGDLKAEDIPSSLREQVTKEPSTYTVNLAVEPEDLLDWDLPLSKQPEKVRKAFEKVYIDYLGKPPYETNIKYLYDNIAGQSGAYKAADASAALRAAGIPGLRYLDQGSRGGGEGTRNVVLFDETLAEILERNGMPVTRK